MTNRNFLVVHPYSNRFSQIMALESEDYRLFKKEKDYLMKITNFISTANEDLIITQPEWCLSKIIEKIRRIKPKANLKVIATFGDPWDGDNPEPRKGWEELEKYIEGRELDELIIIGAQLKVNRGLIKTLTKYSNCVGITYNEMKKRFSKNTIVKLNREFCLEY